MQKIALCSNVIGISDFFNSRTNLLRYNSFIFSVGDCEIVASKNDKLFEDDIVIVVSDAYREKKREERRKKKEAAAVSSRSDQNLPSTSSGLRRRMKYYRVHVVLVISLDLFQF